MSNFGDVTYADAPAADSTAPAGVNGSEQPILIDPNDPRLTSEVLTIDETADAYAVLPPLPDGKWRMKAKQVDIKDDKGQLQRYAVFSRAKMANGQPFFATNIEYSAIDHGTEEFDGVRITDYWVKTLLDQRKGTSQAATMILKLGGKLPASPTQKAVMDTLLQVLASEPELIYETAWSAECQTCQNVAKKRGEKAPRPFLQGMHRFPATRTPGVHDPIVQCPTCKGQVRAQARLVAPYSLKETQPTRGVAKQG